MLKIERIVVDIRDGHHRRVYKTKRSPTRYYYWSSGKRIYIDEHEVTKEMLDIITH